MTIRPTRDTTGTLADLIDRLLEKGLVLNADIVVSVAGVELLGIKIRAALASFETAAKYGLEFPTGTQCQGSQAWRNALIPKDNCPQCGRQVPISELLEEQCPWCGWESPKKRRLALGS